ncbi:DUF1254 domain-containing protein [Streptomyces sp. SMS_SU21]|uniref:DUF1254 domain-containing protein n=1 Tax=Streptomyces sp. SMS_SU21 TaxID=2069440 RepID=UPI0015E7EC7E|nr:DUF1254 domain-containing protein [Streptomyces sp. SMS_SU21]MCA2201997.1 DUF1254 domain-containing protein [Streptomyces sp. SMS_SU21]
MPQISDAPSPGTSPDTLASIVCPDRLETVFGTLDFFDGLPLPEAVTRSYDTLDLLRGIEAFLNCVPGASMVALRRGLRSIGVDSRTIGFTAPRCTSAPVLLTGNTETAYGMTFLALDEDGPTVVEAPGNSLCVVDDLWQRYVTDMGIAGPDQGNGGAYLFLPPGYEGDVPDGYFVVRPRTYASWVVLRALGGTESLLTSRIYPLSAAADPPEQRFVNWAESDFNTVHANDFSFFEEIDTIVQAEPPESLDPERAGQLAALGIVRGKSFRPDDRMRSILDTAARIASGIVRTLAFKPRDPGFYYYPDRSWKTPFPTRSYEFLSEEGARLLDSRSVFYYFATVSSPAMVAAPVGTGSQYAYTAEDSTGAWLDGGRTYTLTLPRGVPAKNFWAVTVYDPQTRSLLRTDTPYPSVNSLSDDVRPEAGGDTVIHFGPTAPEGKEANWIRTVPGKGFFVVLRLYGPLESWFDKSWRPGEIEPA